MTVLITRYYLTCGHSLHVPVSLTRGYRLACPTCDEPVRVVGLQDEGMEGLFEGLFGKGGLFG